MTYVKSNRNGRSGSTTWRAEPDRMSAARREATQDGRRRRTFRQLRKRDSREPLTIKVRYRGGKEAWVLVEARGVVQAFPGHLCIYDVVRAINSEG